MEDVFFKFERDFDTNGYLPVSVGRIFLASGNPVRIIFTKNGLKVIIPKESQSNGDITWTEDIYYGGLR